MWLFSRNILFDIVNIYATSKSQLPTSTVGFFRFDVIGGYRLYDTYYFHGVNFCGIKTVADGIIKLRFNFDDTGTVNYWSSQTVDQPICDDIHETFTMSRHEYNEFLNI